MKYDFRTERTKGRVQINIGEWQSPDSDLIHIYRMNGKAHVTYITKACYVGEEVNGVQKGDSLLLSKVACDVATTPFASYKIEENSYFDIPEEQIMGVFSNNKININSLRMRGKNILFKKIEKRQNSTLVIEEKNTMIGEVVKVGEDSSLKIGDLVAVGDNVSTPVEIGGGNYFAVEEKFIVGVLQKDLQIENMKIINEYVLMKSYIAKNVLNSTVLETSGIDYDYLDYSDINNRNLFKVEYADKSLGNIKKGDIILLDRNYTNYMYYNNEKYFVINDKKWILGKIIERDKQCN